MDEPQIGAGMFWVMWLTLFPVFAFQTAQSLHERHYLRMTGGFWLAWLATQNIAAGTIWTVCRARHMPTYECLGWLIVSCIILGIALVLYFSALQVGKKPLEATIWPAIFIGVISGIIGYFAMFFVIAAHTTGFWCGVAIGLWLIAPGAIAGLCSVEPEGAKK